MAKKASSPAPAKSTSAKAANGKPAAAKRAAPKPPKAPKAAGPAISCEAIGSAAGHVWQALADNGPASLASLKKSVDQPADMVLAALGWLAREDKLEFGDAGKTVSLK